MGLFGPPDVKGLKARHDLKGLVKALSYRENSYDFKDVAIRNGAAQAIGNLGDPQAVALVFARLLESHGTTGYFEEAAVKALAGIGQPALDALIAGLDHPDASIRAMAAGALGSNPDPRSVEALLNIVQRADQDVLNTTVRALGNIKDRRAVEPLLKLLGSGQSSLDMDVIEALGEIGDPRAVEPLLSVLHNNDLCLGTIKALGKIGDKRAVEPVLRFMHNKSGDIRVTAATTLGLLKDPRAVKALLDFVGDKTMWAAPHVGITALNQIKEPPIADLVHALKERDSNVADITQKLLVKAGSSAVKPLISKLKSEGSYVRYSAANILKTLYHQGRITPEEKALILGNRDGMIEPHTDSHSDFPSSCDEPHSDSHADQGIGIDFPL
jgi:HEAT repeat protein